LRHYVSLWLTSTSKEEDIKRIVRASTGDDAIISLMKALDLGYVHAACAYPIKKRKEDLSPNDWRNNIYCSVSGKVSILSSDNKLA